MIQEQSGLANNIIGSVHFSILVNEQALQKEGHPKWKDVLFKGYTEGITHKGVINSIGACNVIQDFGYNCNDLALSRKHPSKPSLLHEAIVDLRQTAHLL